MVIPPLSFQPQLAGQRAKRRGRDRPAQPPRRPGASGPAPGRVRFAVSPARLAGRGRGGHLAVTSAHRRCVGDRRSRHLRAHIMPDGGLHLTGVDLRPTLQNPQVRPGSSSAALTLAAGADLRSSGYVETPNARYEYRPCRGRGVRRRPCRRQCARCSRRGLIAKRGRERPGSGLPNICCMPMVMSPQPGGIERSVPAPSRSRSGDSWCRSRRSIGEIRDDEHDRARAKRSDQEAAANGRRAG
jgi:hypothetical protein